MLRLRLWPIEARLHSIAPKFSFACLAFFAIASVSYTGKVKAEVEQATMCLAENIYHEARGENREAKYVLGMLTLARMSDPDPQWPKTICGVVAQGKQYSWTLDYRLATTVTEQQKMEEAKYIAADIIRNAWTGYALPKGWECARFFHRTDNHGVSDRSKRDSDEHLFPVGYFGSHTAFQNRHGCKFHLPTT